MQRSELFDRLRPLKADQSFSAADVGLIDAIADDLGLSRAAKVSNQFATDLTVPIVLEVASHEAIVPEWYLDSEKVGTWAMGVTNASGHNVDRYKDNPQPLRKCIEVSVWLMRTKYLPQVLEAFAGHPLTEAQLAAALSFNWNTEAIRSADWVKAWKLGSIETARSAIMNWRSPASIIPRREKERDLFFDGEWSNDGKTTIYDVVKPSYSPKWSSARRVDISADVAAVLATSA
jgi:lysozyme